ncbi:MAG: cytochrome P450 [Acidimicrobiia bacterium]
MSDAVASSSGVYYDPFDFEIDTDPYPTFRRLRDEAPLYYNEQHDFYALSRFADVEACKRDPSTYISGKGSVLEVIQRVLELGAELPPGIILFEDPPAHTAHRGLLSRVFTPRRMNAIEPQVRAFCAASLDPLVGSGGFDFIGDLGAEMPMRTIGMLLGIPEEDQVAIRDRIDASMRLDEDGNRVEQGGPEGGALDGSGFADYIDWRAEHPSDDLMTDLLNAEFEDETGTRRKLSREEILSYVGLLASAGNETTTRLIGWTGKVLAENPDQRAELHRDRALIPNAIEELLRYESPSPVQARYVTADVEHYGHTLPAGSIVLALTASANRDEREFPDPDRFDIHRKIDHHVAFGYGIHFCLGAALARLEGRVALDEVLTRFPTWEVDWDNAVQAHTSTVRGWAKLPVRVP